MKESLAPHRGHTVSAAMTQPFTMLSTGDDSRLPPGSPPYGAPNHHSSAATRSKITAMFRRA
jgi:hypothetical protein